MKRYLQILARHPHPWRFLAAKILVATGLCRCLTIPQNGYRLRFHPANLPASLWIDPGMRVAPLAFLNAYLKPGDTVVDVGANVGDTVLTAAVRVGDSGHVFGIEAHPRTFGFLQENIALNGVKNVTLIASAVGGRQGTVRFSDRREDDMNQVDRGSLEVPVSRLDDLIRSTAPIALLKVDVEGYERPVFQGAPRILSQTACLHFEVGEDMCQNFGYTPRQLIAEISALGFQFFVESRRSSLVPLRDGQGFTPYANVIAARDVSNLVERTSWTLEAASAQR